MSLQQDLLSSCAKLMVFELKEGFRAVAHIADFDPENVRQMVEAKFIEIWNYMAAQNAMFTNPYNMKGLI